ncbi:MAG: thermonuclease family protein, partial [Mesorhizobium sp.]
DEWRGKALDKTLARLPVADLNLLAERESEVSPPFDDARKLPARTDR